jgi:hypothetical protein
MKAERIPDGFHATMPPGSICRDEHGHWECCTPNGRRGLLTLHTVTENPDGTVSVQPSIQVDPMVRDGVAVRPGYHGHLTNSVWTPA